MTLQKKLRIYFFSADQGDLLEGETRKRHSEVIIPEADFKRGEPEQYAMTDPDHEVLREEVKANRRRLNETRIWLSRIDERTAFIARIIFVLFMAFIVSVGAGLVLAFVF